MSRIENNRDIEAISPRLRNRFLAWSLAIAGSLTTTGMVGLRPTSAWAQEDPSKVQKEEDSAEENKPLDQAMFRKMLTAGELDELAAKIDAALAEKPEDSALIGMNSTLGMYMARNKPTEALARFESQMERLLALEELDQTCLSSLSTTANYLTQLNKELDTEQKLAILDQGLEKISSQTNLNVASAMKSLTTIKSQLLSADGRHDEAKELMDELLGDYRGKISPDNSNSMRSFITFVSTYSSVLRNKFPDAVDTVMLEAEELANQMLKSDSVKAIDFSALYGMKSSEISSLSYSDPKQADAALTSLEMKLAELKERIDEGELKGLSSYEKGIAALRSRLQAALKRELLIGIQAPEIDADAFVAMQPTTMDDLKGKVVLIDFWAVWCGPCIATFPHLIEWHEEYADKGLVILGATKFYNYDWDEEAGKAARSKDEVDAETELAMLEKFRESYGLHHGFFVSGKGSDYSKQFEVSGIPQAVLIDKEGKIQMIRVGSGEANATALHEKIEELLGN